MGNEIILFETKDHAVTLQVPVDNETVWLTQGQMTELFDRDVSVISRHIRNVFKENEVDRESNLQKCKLLILINRFLSIALMLLFLSAIESNLSAALNSGAGRTQS